MLWMCMEWFFTFFCLWFTVKAHLMLSYVMQNLSLVIVLLVLSWQLALVAKRLSPKSRIASQNKTVLITGCDSGFGHLLAKRLHSKGFRVIACCLCPNSSGAKDLLNDCSTKLHVIKLDVTKEEDVNSAVQEVQDILESTNDEFWCLVNNAGITFISEVEWMNMNLFQKIMDVNVLGVVRVTKAFLPFLRKYQGRVVMMGSVSTYFSTPGMVAYSMSKHAITALADGLRRELHKWNVGVSLVIPNKYRTPMAHERNLLETLDATWRDCSDEVRDAYGERYLEAFKKFMIYHTRVARRKTEEVIDKLDDAVTLTHPEMTSVCAGSFFDHIVVWIMRYMPAILFEPLVQCFLIKTKPSSLIRGAS